MNNAIANLFSGQVANAVSRTLIHSLWQGALLSVVTGLVMACTRKASSAIRYNLLVAAMALFAVAVAGTFCFEFSNGDTHIPPSAGQNAGNSMPVLHETTIYTVAPNSSIWETISSYLNRYASIIAWTWLLIVCARCLQLVTGLREVYRLRHKNISGIGNYWEEQVRQLSDQLGIKRLVGIAQSARAKAPMVTGHLKPLILIPIGMFTSLSTEEAEAVLLHELAHIRRSDYLVNLLQNMMEIVLFFNPAVLWLSALIKAERENCCDDIAVARSGKLNYLKALVACGEYNMPPSSYAMALKSSNGGLKKRVARIIHNKNESLNRAEKALLAVCLITVGIFATAFANGGRPDKHSSATVQKTAAVQPKADGIAGGNADTVYAPKATDTTKPRKNTNASGENTAADEQTAEAKQKSDSERTMGIISDMMKDGIITSPIGLSFKIGTDEFVVNYQKQPDAVYQKYRPRYVTSQLKGNGDWVWYYQFDSQKYRAIVAHKYNDAQTRDTTTGIFHGKLNQ